MKISELPVLTDCSIFRNTYLVRPEALVLGRLFSSLSFRISGSTRIRGEGFDFISGPKSLTFVPAGCEYRACPLEAGEMIVMHFYSENSCGPIPAAVPAPFPQATHNLFESAERRYTAHGCDLSTMSFAYQLLAEAEAIFAPRRAVASRMKRCKRYLDENITDPSLRIRDLAQMFGASEVWFRREFEQCYGVPPLEYLKTKRIETAKLLLQTGLYTVTDVALRAGFSNACYFSAEFRRSQGMSPSEFKARKG